MTIGREGKSRNVLASPLGEEGHEVAQGCTTLQAGLILSAALTANRQPSRRFLFNSICLISGTYRDSSLTLRMTMGREGNPVTLGSFLRKELPDRAEEHRIPAYQHLTAFVS